MSKQVGEERIPPEPDGWERLRPGRPLLVNCKNEVTLQWCPLCGPEVEFAEVGEAEGYVNRTNHFLEEHTADELISGGEVE